MFNVSATSNVISITGLAVKDVNEVRHEKILFRVLFKVQIINVLGRCKKEKQLRDFLNCFVLSSESPDMSGRPSRCDRDALTSRAIRNGILN